MDMLWMEAMNGKDGHHASNGLLDCCQSATAYYHPLPSYRYGKNLNETKTTCSTKKVLETDLLKL